MHGNELKRDKDEMYYLSVTFLLGYEKHPRVLAARPFCFELGPPR